MLNVLTNRPEVKPLVESIGLKLGMKVRLATLGSRAIWPEVGMW